MLLQRPLRGEACGFWGIHLLGFWGLCRHVAILNAMLALSLSLSLAISLSSLALGNFPAVANDRPVVVTGLLCFRSLLLPLSPSLLAASLPSAVVSPIVAPYI